MANITTTERRGALPRWIWFIALWCAGVGSALLVGEAFKLLMNATLFAVSK
jgi:hypothetical protein